MGKKAPTKVPLLRQIWQWTEHTSPDSILDEHVRVAYRLKLGKCTHCRKNCAGNPTCLRGLGESAWFREGHHESVLQSDIEDLDRGLRKEGDFVGLKNLGATCYVNTFLQLWFHNLNFRKTVYQFQVKNGSEENGNKHTPPRTVLEHLQLIFGMLQRSARKNIDPTPLITCLGLDTGLQQDAQEFSKLFLNLLESASTVADFLCQEFCGEYNYCTTCGTCGHVSKRPSRFYELDLSIQDHKDVTQCLTEFFKEEQLNHENQYHCDRCNCKQDASRRIDVKSLPRTLNLQLLRFVFDKTTWNKKKLSHFISFPDTLDMSPYVSKENIPAEDMLYELTAVLMHRGPTAFSGHYIAHIKDYLSQLWHKFNDESIVQMKSGKSLNLDAADDFDSDLLPKPIKRPRLKKNCHSSKNAYMLVYTKKKEMPSPENPVSIPSIPVAVEAAVEEDNKGFRCSIDSIKQEARKLAEVEIKKHNEMAELVKKMQDMTSEELLSDCYWVPTAWLKHILDSSQANKKSFSSEKFLCAHRKLDPDRIGGLKCIPACVTDHFFSLCEGECPRIGDSMMCGRCVRDRCVLMRLKSSLKEDHASVTKLLKEHSNGVATEYYIGRSSLRYWKSMALRSVENKNDEENENIETKNGTEKLLEEDGDSDCDDFDFNEDLLCEHGGLTIDTDCYRLVPASVWDIISKYFPKAPIYKKGDSTQCFVCRDKESDVAQLAELKKRKVQDQKSNLANLLYNKNRPKYEDIYDVKRLNDSDGPVLFVVSECFLRKWRDYIRNSSKHEEVSELGNRSLLCPHDKLFYEPVLSSAGFGADDDEPITALLWPQEWEYLEKNFFVDATITITKKLVTDHVSEAEKFPEFNRFSTEKSESQILNNNNGGKSSNESELNCNGTAKILDPSSEVKAKIMTAEPETCSKINLIYQPEMCMECIEGRALEVERNLRHYKEADIYVRRVILDANTKSTSTPFVTASGKGGSQPNSQRRSRRTHTTRDGKKVTVSSSWTLKQLKIKIMSLFSIPPFDQNLWLDSKVLSDDQATLGYLSITPGCMISLVADEPDDKSLEMLPVLSEKQPINLEEGFKGTSLISN